MAGAAAVAVVALVVWSPDSGRESPATIAQQEDPPPIPLEPEPEPTPEPMDERELQLAETPVAPEQGVPETAPETDPVAPARPQPAAETVIAQPSDTAPAEAAEDTGLIEREWVLAMADGPAPDYAAPADPFAWTRMTGATRSGSAAQAGLHALVPSHVAHTTAAAPRLFWMTETDLPGPITFVWTLETTGEFAEYALPAPVTRGIHAIDLTELGLELERDAVYTWSIIAPAPGRADDEELMTMGAIRRVARTPDLERIAAGPRAARAHAYAERGLWYDALDVLSTAIETEGAPTRLARQRAALLDQVGLEAAAAWDRERGGD